MKILSKKMRNSCGGQVVVEYILLIAVMGSLIFSLLGFLKGELLLPADKICTEGDKSFACSLQRISQGFGTSDPHFRFFNLLR